MPPKPQSFENVSTKKSDAPNEALHSLATKLFSEDTNAPWKRKNGEKEQNNAVDHDGYLSFGATQKGSNTAEDVTGQRSPMPVRTTGELNRESAVIREGSQRTNGLIKERKIDGRTVTTVDTEAARKLGFVVGNGLEASTFSEINKVAKTEGQIISPAPTGKFRDTSSEKNISTIDFDAHNIYEPLRNAHCSLKDNQSAKKNPFKNDAIEWHRDDCRPYDRTNSRAWWRDYFDRNDLNKHQNNEKWHWHRRCDPHRPNPPRDNPRPPLPPVPPRDVPPAPPAPPRDVPPAPPPPVPPRDNPPPPPPKDVPPPPKDVPPTPPGNDKPASADLKAANERFDGAASKLSASTREELTKSRDEMIKGCRDRGLSDTEIAKTLDQVSRLIETKSAVLDPGSEQQARIAAAAGIMKNATKPDVYVNQGAHNSCNVTTVEERTFNNYPARAAQIVTDSVLTGQYTSLDGKTVKLHPDALRPDSEARRNQLQGENLRSYTSQIFQAAVLTDLGSRNNPPVQYIANGGPGASGEGWITQSGQKYSFNGTSLQDIVNMNRYANGDSNVVAAGFGSPAELESWIKANAGKQPLILGVNGSDPLFYGDHTRSDGQTGGLNHVVSIREYDQANHRVRVSNQWGAGMDFWVDISLLYQAT